MKTRQSTAGDVFRGRRRSGQLGSICPQLRIRAPDLRRHPDSALRLSTAADRVWHCSQRLALARAYPAELDLLAQALGLPYRKDPAARKAMLAVSRPRANRKRKSGTIPMWDEDPEKLKLLYERCKLDVITTRAVWQSPKLKPLSETERRYQLQDMAINDRGIRLDCTFATAARDLAIHERIAINLKLGELTDGSITSVDQTKRFLDAINAHGHAMTTLNKRAVAQVLGEQTGRLCRATARAPPRRSPRQRQQVQANVVLRLAGGRSHARHAADVWRRSRALVGARAAIAEPQEERIQPAALGGRFDPRRRSCRYRGFRQSFVPARRHLPRRALQHVRQRAQVRRLLSHRIRDAGQARRRAVETRRLRHVPADRRHAARALQDYRAPDAA